MKKKMSREERAEYKGGKYTGGPAEERAEKKKGKRMAMGGPAGDPYGKGSERPGMKKPQLPGRGMVQRPLPGRGMGQPFRPGMKPPISTSVRTPVSGNPIGSIPTLAPTGSAPRPANPYNTTLAPNPGVSGATFGVNYGGGPLVDKSQQANPPQGLSPLAELSGSGDPSKGFGLAFANANPGSPVQTAAAGYGNNVSYAYGPAMKAGGKVKRMAKGGIVKKTKKMAMGGVAPPAKGNRRGIGTVTAPASLPIGNSPISGMPPRPGMKAGGKVKRMADGGMVSTPTAQPKPRGMDKPINPGMLNKYTKMKERFPTYSWGNTAPTTRGQFRTMMEGFRDYRDDQNDAARDARRASKIGEQYSKISSRFPGYKPTTEGPVDTKEELRTYMRGMGDYRRANPGIRPVRPGKPDVTTQTKRGGGLARKGVGQALARGGLVKANGCAARGKTKGKMV